MKVDYFSDIHVNHWVGKFEDVVWERKTKTFLRSMTGLGSGDVIIFAGDFSEYNKQTIWILEVLSELYEKVFFVFGNHDYYIIDGQFETSFDRIKDIELKINHLRNISCLNNKAVHHKGYTFAGSTLWYALKTPFDWQYYNSFSMDSKYIVGKQSEYKDHVQDMLHVKDKRWYKSMYNTQIDVMVSHLPPINPPFAVHKPNPLFYTEVDFLLAKHWVFGHQHLEGTFEKAGTNFYVNDIGYPNEKLTHEIKQFEL